MGKVSKSKKSKVYVFGNEKLHDRVKHMEGFVAVTKCQVSCRLCLVVRRKLEERNR